MLGFDGLLVDFDLVIANLERQVVEDELLDQLRLLIIQTETTLQDWDWHRRPELLAQHLHNQAVFNGYLKVAKALHMQLANRQLPQLLLQWHTNTSTSVTPFQTLHEQRNEVYDVAVINKTDAWDSEVLVVILTEHALYTWDFERGQFKNRRAVRGDITTRVGDHVRLRPKQETLKILTTKRRQLQQWDVTTNIIEQSIPLDFIAPIKDIAITADGRYAAITLLFGKHNLRVVSLAEPQKVMQYPEPGWVSAVAILSDDGQVAFSWGQDMKSDTLIIWNWHTGEKQFSLQVPSSICAISVMHAARHLVTGHWNGSITVWDWANGQQLHTWEGHRERIVQLTITADDQYLISAANDNNIIVWELHTGMQVGMFAGHEAEINSLAVTRTGDFLISSSKDGVINSWSLSELKKGGKSLYNVSIIRQ